MLPTLAPISVEEAVRESVQSWTGRRVRGLAVVVRGRTVVLAGTAASFHVKQLAQRGAQEVLPHAALANEIVVETACR
jgi:hypothetical protein